jgi:UDP-glucose 4-epimerase
MDVDPVSTTELVTILSKELGKRPTLFRMPGSIGKIIHKIFPQHYEQLFNSLVLDNSKSREKLDFTPPYTIGQGLSRMIDFYKSSHPKKSKNLK